MMFQSRMKIYSVYLDPKDKHPYETAKFIPEGFNLYAFIFTGFWAMAKRMWWMAALFLCLYIGSPFYGHMVGLSVTSSVLLELGFRIMIGLAANDLWCSRLEKKGWILSDVIVAYNELEASHRYYNRHLQAANAATNVATSG